MTSDATQDGAHYLLGHTDHELRRLDIQGDLYRDATLRAFRDAGIEPGMRVLDIGCGTGDVSRAVATVVGEAGSVLGIDRGERAVEAAREWARDQGLNNVDFAVSEIDEFHSTANFDAVVGRFILMHQPDPAQVLASVVRSLRAGGVVCMIESYMDALLSGPHSFPASPLYDEIVRWKSAVVAGAGSDLHAGGRLKQLFGAAGLPQPRARLEARLEGGADSPYYEYIAHSVRSMLPEAERQGLGGFTNADADTLERRLRDEVLASRGMLVAWPVVAAFCRTETAPATAP
ncbi:MAG: class I SAM-dependent methyltransferase [Gemmatimonadetes bacterium]|nr:class I SAM-dependent methyltransferase [Gemmatimonadota bacterium]